MSTRHLLVFTRWPEPGHTKTRLIAALGPEGAADLQEWLTGYTLLQARLWAAHPDNEIHLYTTGAPPRRFTQWLGPDIKVHPQADGNLGQRLSAAAARSFQEGAGEVVMIGIDCPGVTEPLLSKAFEALRTRDAVIGSATDGGYTLLGSRNFSEEIFRDIPWGTSRVLEQTWQRFRELEWSFDTLPALQDIDEPLDLPEVEAHRAPEQRSGLSIVLIAKDEEPFIEEAVASARNEADEVILVDGGSEDRTVDLARSAGARVIHSPSGRGRQMNAGADQTSFNTLMFVHADSRISPGAGKQVVDALREPDVTLTALRLNIEGSRHAYRWIEAAVQFRSRILQRPYGDQSLALSRETFTRLGGFADLPLLEDLDLVRRAGRRGRIRILPATSTVSDRRWRSKGVFRTTLLNQIILLGDRLGVSVDRLRSWYLG